MKAKLGLGLLSHRLCCLFARAFLVAGFFICSAIGLAQITPPVLTVTPVGTNQFSVTFTNSPPTTWDLQWTPALNGSDFNWGWLRTGTNSQTNFVFSMDDLSGSPTAFFRTILDTNSIPLWEAADPNNPGAGILTVIIDSPTNGETIQ
ncbi:MAG TPA: hypothetical protein VFF11_07280 [Candidatus Binatia bacterium]|nr:hypothetical protein [Candidatus Binatia bacterium]